MSLLFIIFIIFVALVFDYTNGMHDAANSISTVVSTRVLTPRQAVIWAAVFNFVAFLIFSTTVAETIGNGMIDIKTVTPTVILAGLGGAILWNITTWYFGLPSSSSHALIGGYAGAAVVKSGLGVIIVSGWYKTLIFIVLAPTIGLCLGFILKIATMWLTYKQRPAVVNKWSRVFQLFSAALYSLGHGGNDAQKTMGIIALTLLGATKAGQLDHLPAWLSFLHTPQPATLEIALWIKVVCALTMAAGTAVGGWRIIKTLGHKMVKLHPINGFAAETSSAAVILAATHLGIPVSTTHNISAAIMGVGAARRLNAIKWTVVERMVWAWMLTIPVCAALAYALVRLLPLAAR